MLFASWLSLFIRCSLLVGRRPLSQNRRRQRPIVAAEQLESRPMLSAPSFGSSPTLSVPEDGAINDSVGSVAATDADNDITSYSLSGSGSELFSIDSSGTLTINGWLSYESQSNYTLTVTVFDGMEGDESMDTATTSVTINVTDVAEAPSFSSGSYNFSVAENLSSGTLVGTLIVTDPQNDAFLTIASGDSGNLFTIDASGQLQLNAPLDFESQTTYTLTIEASDLSGEPGVSTTVNVTVTNAIELPVFTPAAYTFDITENVSIGTTIGTVSVYDPTMTWLSYAIMSGNTNGAFAIDAMGVITVASDIDFETTASYTLQVDATNADGSETATVTIAVKNIAITVEDVSAHAWEDTNVFVHLYAYSSNDWIGSFEIDINGDGIFDATVTSYDSLVEGTDEELSLLSLLGTPIDNGTFTGSVRITTYTGEFLTVAMTTTVLDAPPTSAVTGGGEEIAIGDTLNLTLDSITDAGDDTVTSVTVDWGDGTVDVFSPPPTTFSHVYTTSGEFAITIRATNEDGTFEVAATDAFVAVNPNIARHWQRLIQRLGERAVNDFSSVQLIAEIRRDHADNNQYESGRIDIPGAAHAVARGYDNNTLTRWTNDEERRIQKIDPDYRLVNEVKTYIMYNITPNVTHNGKKTGEVNYRIYLYVDSKVMDGDNVVSHQRRKVWQSGATIGYDETYANTTSVRPNPNPEILPQEI